MENKKRPLDKTTIKVDHQEPKKLIKVATGEDEIKKVENSEEKSGIAFDMNEVEKLIEDSSGVSDNISIDQELLELS